MISWCCIRVCLRFNKLVFVLWYQISSDFARISPCSAAFAKFAVIRIFPQVCLCETCASGIASIECNQVLFALNFCSNSIRMNLVQNVNRGCQVVECAHWA